MMPNIVGVRADAQREGRDHGYRQPRRARDLSQRVFDIVPQCIELVGHRQYLLSATRRGMEASPHLGKRTEQSMRFGRRRVRRPAPRDELCNAHLDVKPDLVVHLGLGARGSAHGEAKEAAHAGA